MLAAGIAFAVFSLAVARGEPEYSFAGGSAAVAAVEFTAGLALLATGFLAWTRGPASRFGSLLIAASFGWFLLEWNNPGAGSAFVFTTGLVLFFAAPPLLAHAILSYPEGRLARSSGRAGVAAAYLGAILLLGLLPGVVFDPPAGGCSECPRNLLLISGDTGTYTSFNRIGVHFGLGWALALIVLAGWQFAHSTPARRRLVAPVLSTGCVYLGLVAAEFAHSLDRGFLGYDPVDRRFWLWQGVALGAVSLAVVWGWLRARRTRSEIARLVVELARSPDPGGLQASLGQSLGDPSLQIAYPIADQSRYVDATGRPVEIGDNTTPLVRAGQEVARLVHRTGLFDDPDLVRELQTAARLTLDNEQLQAETRAQLQDLQESRSRIVAASDAERRRLERNLHDGAQQQLVALSLSLRLARSRLAGRNPAALAQLEPAEAELRAALEDLRKLAHGIFPAVLSDEGLAAAIEALKEETATPIRITSMPVRRLDSAVESAAYFVVSEAVKRSGAGPITIAAACRDGLLVIEVEGAGTDLALVDLEDRVGAVGGRLELVRVPNAPVTIRAEIPCES